MFSSETSAVRTAPVVDSAVKTKLALKLGPQLCCLLDSVTVRVDPHVGGATLGGTRPWPCMQQSAQMRMRIRQGRREEQDSFGLLLVCCAVWDRAPSDRSQFCHSRVQSRRLCLRYFASARAYKKFPLRWPSSMPLWRNAKNWTTIHNCLWIEWNAHNHNTRDLLDEKEP
jgi:hypothetical protein